MTRDRDDFLQCLTEEGRKALRDDTQMDDENRLILEIMNRAGAIDEIDATEIYEVLMTDYGSAAAAIEALQSGDAHIYWDDEE